MESVNNEKLGKVSGGMANPVSGVSFADAMKRAKEFGPVCKDEGGYITMNDAAYLKWWKSCNPEEYAKHKAEVDPIIDAFYNKPTEE